jgi:hypothetical protein
MMVFVHGKQKWVARPQLIDGIPVDQFIAQNADPIWLHINGLWELIPWEDQESVDEGPSNVTSSGAAQS